MCGGQYSYTVNQKYLKYDLSNKVTGPRERLFNDQLCNAKSLASLVSMRALSFSEL